MNKKEKVVLIVDDETEIREAISEKFSDVGYKTLEAKNGEEGLELALKNHPDIILLDIIMPKMDGLAMLQKLRVDEWGQQVPVIMLTNINDTTYLAKALEIGIDEYLLKAEWKMKSIVEKVYSIIGD